MKHRIASKNFILKVMLQRNLQSVVKESSLCQQGWIWQKEIHKQIFHGNCVFCCLRCPGRENLFTSIPDMKLTQAISRESSSFPKLKLTVRNMFKCRSASVCLRNVMSFKDCLAKNIQKLGKGFLTRNVSTALTTMSTSHVAR